VLMRQVYDAAKVVSDRFYRVRNQHQQLCASMTMQKLYREVPKVEIRLTGKHIWCLAVQVIVHNNKPCLANKVSMEITFDGPDARMLPDTLFFDADALKHIPGESSGDYPTYTIECNEGVEGARNLTSTFEMYVPIGEDIDGFTMKVSATATVDGVRVSGYEEIEMKPQLSIPPTGATGP